MVRYAAEGNETCLDVRAPLHFLIAAAGMPRGEGALRQKPAAWIQDYDTVPEAHEGAVSAEFMRN